MKEKSVTFCFLKLNAKEKANFSKITGGGEGGGGGGGGGGWGRFCGEFWSLLSKLMFTHSSSC